MTRDGLKAYLTQISQSDDPVASRWEPTILCSMIDTVSDEDILGLIKTPRVCSNCKFKIVDTYYDIHRCLKVKMIDICNDDFGCTYWENKE